MNKIHFILLLMVLPGLTSCQPLATGKIIVKSKDRLSANTEDRILEVTEIVEVIARQSGFTPEPASGRTDKVLLSMYKHNEDRILSSVVVSFENNIIKIYVRELNNPKLSENALRLQNEISCKLNQSLKDCCIIITDNKYSGRK